MQLFIFNNDLTSAVPNSDFSTLVTICSYCYSTTHDHFLRLSITFKLKHVDPTFHSLYLDTYWDDNSGRGRENLKLHPKPAHCAYKRLHCQSVKPNNNIQPWCYSFMHDVDMEQIFLLFARQAANKSYNIGRAGVLPRPPHRANALRSLILF